MKYVILSKGCPFGNGDAIWGYVESEELAKIVVERWNSINGNEKFYFIEVDNTSPLYKERVHLG